MNQLPDDIVFQGIFKYLKVLECLNTQVALQRQLQTDLYYRFRFKHEPRVLTYQNILFESHHGDSWYCVKVTHELSSSQTVTYKVSMPTANSTTDAILRTKKFLCHPPEHPVALSYFFPTAK